MSETFKTHGALFQNLLENNSKENFTNNRIQIKSFYLNREIDYREKE